MKVVGIINSSGDFNGKPYHNLVLQCTDENKNDKKDICGLIVDTVKIRYADLDAVFGMGLADPSDAEKLQASAFDDYLGAEIEVAYNKYGAVNSVKVISAPTKSEPIKNDSKPSNGGK